MGKGDKKTKKGKRWKGSYGNTRLRKKNEALVVKPITTATVPSKKK